MPERFEITSEAPNGRITRRWTNYVVAAWDWFAYFTKKAPRNEVRIVDHEWESIDD